MRKKVSITKLSYPASCERPSHSEEDPLLPGEVQAVEQHLALGIVRQVNGAGKAVRLQQWVKLELPGRASNMNIGTTGFVF